MPRFKPQIFSPDDVLNPKDHVPGLGWDQYPIRLLAQGDSWFSFGALPAWATTNILDALILGRQASIINCASPGQRLPRMMEWKRNREFLWLLTDRHGYKWDGILLSGGGNDLIAAAAVPPVRKDGTPEPPGQRLLLRPDEWGPAAKGAARYLSDAGWAAFSVELAGHFADVLRARDADINRGVPVFCHTYAYPMPRNSPACHEPKLGPWLYPSLRTYQIPAEDWLAVSTSLIDRLAELLREVVAELGNKGYAAIYLIGTEKALKPAEQGSTGPSNDWENEIHPTPGGYGKLAALWSPAMDRVLL